MSEEFDRPLGKAGGARIGAARQQSIVSLVARGEIIAVGELADHFGVSQETIRRDIRLLEEAGQLRRVHGGAAPAAAVDLTARRPVEERLQLESEGKLRAARAALPLFRDRMNVFLGGSSTMLILARELASRKLALTVTTNMIDIASVMAEDPGCEVTLVGGVLRASTHTLTGPDMLNALEQRVFDLAVCGASAIDPVFGFLAPTEWHAAIGSTLSRRSRSLAFVADATKFERSDARIVQPLTNVDALATDCRPPEAMVKALGEAGVRLLLPQDLSPEQGSEGMRL